MNEHKEKKNSSKDALISNFDEFQKIFYPKDREKRLLDDKDPRKVGENIVKIAVERAEGSMLKK